MAGVFSTSSEDRRKMQKFVPPKQSRCSHWLPQEFLGLSRKFLVYITVCPTGMCMIDYKSQETSQLNAELPPLVPWMKSHFGLLSSFHPSVSLGLKLIDHYGSTTPSRLQIKPWSIPCFTLSIHFNETALFKAEIYNQAEKRFPQFSI